MITTFYPPCNFGGDGVFVRSLSNELAARGHQVEVIFCKDAYRFLARREPPPITDSHPNITLHGLESSFGALSPLASQQTGRLLFKQGTVEQILNRGFDVIHFHNISLMGGPEVLTYGEGIKLYTTHEYWLVCPMHVLYRYNRELCDKPDCLTCTLSYGRPPQWWRYTNLLHRSRGFDFPMMHLPNFSPHPMASANLTPIQADGAPYFLFVGRLEKLKGLQTVIPVFRKYPKARLLIAGHGSYESELRGLAGDADNIQFLGHIDHGRLESLYRGAVSVIIPSLTYEMFGLVAVEAFANHTPVVARDIGGLTELVQESGGGLLFQDDGSLLEAMELLTANNDLRQTLGGNGHEAYQREWTPDAHLKRYLGLIDEIDQSKRSDK